jgi:hypothetical protein
MWKTDLLQTQNALRNNHYELPLRFLLKTKDIKTWMNTD